MDVRPNVFDAEFEFDPDDPPGYRAGIARVGKQAEGREQAVKLFEIPPHESLCPYHYEYVEEWLLVLEGDVQLRTPKGVEALTRGDLVAFPPGPDGAHKLTNPGGPNAVVLMWSSAQEPAVAVYPDSDKIGVWVPGEADNVILRREDGARDYYDGETSGLP